MSGTSDSTSNCVMDSTNSPLILVIDDDDVMQTLMHHVLEKEGYRVVGACNGEEGLKVYELLSPDLIILDCIMPIMDGLTFCQELRRSKDLLIPVLMATSLTDDEIVNQAFAVGVTEYTTKPINWSLLCQTVDKLLQAKLLEIKQNQSETV